VLFFEMGSAYKKAKRMVDICVSLFTLLILVLPPIPYPALKEIQL